LVKLKKWYEKSQNRKVTWNEFARVLREGFSYLLNVSIANEFR
tara:strand:- start:138 stop:266 length:129 start_codon:yes stop_codon:yes gene_type:complete